MSTKNKPNSGNQPAAKITAAVPPVETPKVETPAAPTTPAPTEPIINTGGSVDGEATASTGTDDQSTVGDTPTETAIAQGAPATDTPPVTDPAPTPETVESFIMNKHKLTRIPFEIQFIIDKLNVYADHMNPLVPLNDKQVVEYQYDLHRVVMAALTMRDTKDLITAGVVATNGSYVVALDTVMWYFRTFQSAAFDEMMLHRRLDALRIDGKQYQFLQLMISAMCQVTANPASKRRVNWAAITNLLASVDQKQRIIAYFAN